MTRSHMDQNQAYCALIKVGFGDILSRLLPGVGTQGDNLTARQVVQVSRQPLAPSTTVCSSSRSAVLAWNLDTFPRQLLAFSGLRWEEGHDKATQRRSFWPGQLFKGTLPIVPGHWPCKPVASGDLGVPSYLPFWRDSNLARLCWLIGIFEEG